MVDRQTKEGVNGVGLQFYTPYKKDQETMLLREVKTDAKGEYTVRVLPGQVRGYVNACPKEYTVPDAGPWLRRPPISEDSTWPVIELERGNNIEGIVVDESGQAGHRCHGVLLGRLR